MVRRVDDGDMNKLKENIGAGIFMIVFLSIVFAIGHHVGKSKEAQGLDYTCRCWSCTCHNHSGAK
jgi:hypothetical protein